MGIRNDGRARLRRACAVACGVLTFGVLAMAGGMDGPAQAQDPTRVFLQVDVPGRANANRHRLTVMQRQADGRDSMLALSCRVADPSALGAVLQLGEGAAIPPDGLRVAITTQAPVHRLSRRMGSSDAYLFMNGDEAIATFRQLLAAEEVRFDAGAAGDASFRLAADRPRVERFRQLCALQ